MSNEKSDMSKTEYLLSKYHLARSILVVVVGHWRVR